MRSIKLAFAALVASVAAQAPGTSVNYLDNFDTFLSDPYNSTLNLADCKIGGALCYQAFRVATPDPFLIQPHSLPNDIISGSSQQAAEGSPQFYIDSTTPSATYSASAPGPTCFDLNSLCYAVGIVIGNAGIVVAQQTGTIQLTGTAASGATQSVNVTSTRPIGSNPGRFDCTPVNIQCVQKVDVELVEAQVGTTWSGVSGIRFDDIAYTAWY